MPIAIVVIGLLIVVGLTTYATMLLVRLQKQKKAREAAISAQQHAIKERQQKILGDIRYIAQAMIEDRCEISEGVLRIAKLFEALALTERVVDDFPATYQHYELIKTHPILEQRAALPKQERMRLDLDRMKSESHLQQAILSEAKTLASFELKPTH
ncbi:DUF2489 domain-containing protein [Shewanella avicenniae]|uniref:DUF2489 domain-containing protein n=1 Tax=Shewanella avicenniae TaxID=2814294 RepID=A0ABX7QQ95_9GAMM|nr:DUF2489 domain-containing protein [Shewanella avicenniae]QSX33642.1 DUF2489 domain-containing protein [Shewanella avicenniae]